MSEQFSVLIISTAKGLHPVHPLVQMNTRKVPCIYPNMYVLLGMVFALSLLQRSTSIFWALAGFALVFVKQLGARLWHLPIGDYMCPHSG